jgi:hypothetical protein
MERLTVYGYWPWGMNYPRFRKAKTNTRKKAILVSSCAAPGIIGRLLYTSQKQLKMTAKIIGAESVGTLFTGMISDKPQRELPQSTRQKAQAMAAKLV